MRRAGTTEALLLLLLVCAGVGRWQSAARLFSPTSPIAGTISGDEVVYIYLGDRLVRGEGYSTAALQAQLGSFDASRLPSYLGTRLFKHPPLFPLLVGLSRAIFRGWPGAAFYPSLVCGLLAIVATFLLSRALGIGRPGSLLAALLIGVSPVHWIASARIWLDMPLTTLVLLALLSQLRAERDERWFLAAGVCWGLAAMTKYPAIVEWVAVCALAVCERRNRASALFWAGQLIPLGVIVAWFLVRFSFEGASVVLPWRSEVQDWRMFARLIPTAGLFLLALAGVLLGIRSVRNGYASHSSDPGVLLTSAGLVALWILNPEALLAQPWSGWGANELAQSARTFYIIHPLSFDPILAFGLLGVVVLGMREGFSLVCAAWVGMFCFLTVWGNFQSRYGLPLMPLQIILAVQVLREFSDDRSHPGWRKVFIVVIVCTSLARSLWVDWSLALSNDFFYF